jgi:diaminopimelate epimerase
MMTAMTLCCIFLYVGDGVIFALPGQNGCDYTMRIYNSDGSEPQMCGNGIRCMARFLLEVEGKDAFAEQTYTISTNAGRIVPRISKDGSITVDMGSPILEAARVPTTLVATQNGAVVDGTISAAGTSYKVTCVSMGNPHAVSKNNN